MGGLSLIFLVFNVNAINPITIVYISMCFINTDSLTNAFHIASNCVYNA